MLAVNTDLALDGEAESFASLRMLALIKNLLQMQIKLFFTLIKNLFITSTASAEVSVAFYTLAAMW